MRRNDIRRTGFPSHVRFDDDGDGEEKCRDEDSQFPSIIILNPLSKGKSRKMKSRPTAVRLGLRALGAEKAGARIQNPEARRRALFP
jgi:hypothetical protein